MAWGAASDQGCVGVVSGVGCKAGDDVRFSLRENKGFVEERASVTDTPLITMDSDRRILGFLHTGRPVSWHRREPRLAGYGGLYNSYDIRLMIFTAEGNHFGVTQHLRQRGILLHHLSRGCTVLIYDVVRQARGRRSSGNGKWVFNRLNGTNIFLSSASEIVGVERIGCTRFDGKSILLRHGKIQNT